MRSMNLKQCKHITFTDKRKPVAQSPELRVCKGPVTGLVLGLPPYYSFFLSKIQDKTPSTLKYVFCSVLFSIDFFIFTHIAGNLMLNPTS